MPSLLAVSDLHADHAENAPAIDRIRPRTDNDWLIVAGDVADRFGQVVQTLATLRARFARVLWTPGNHEPWTLPDDPVRDRGVDRYDRFVTALRQIGILTPDDPFPRWHHGDGELILAPLFLLPDSTLLPPGTRTATEAFAAAEAAGVVSADDHLLDPSPYRDRAAWAAARIAETRRRLDALPPDVPTLLISHYPLVRQPLRRLAVPEFSLWCGSAATAAWPARYRAVATVHGHLHIPVTTVVDGIPHHEVSLGYPREWQRRSTTPRPGTIIWRDREGDR